MVDIVLRGDAELLIDKKSEDLEVQEFLNNAETFKTKITSIHQGEQYSAEAFTNRLTFSCGWWLTKRITKRARPTEVLHGEGQRNRGKHFTKSYCVGSTSYCKV